MPLDGWMQKCRKLEKEIDRLQGVVASYDTTVRTSDDPQWYIATRFRADHPEAYAQIRNAIIEECALVAETYQGPRSLGDAIRALKSDAGG